jgi:hypothetical protein
MWPAQGDAVSFSRREAASSMVRDAGTAARGVWRPWPEAARAAISERGRGQPVGEVPDGRIRYPIRLGMHPAAPAQAADGRVDRIPLFVPRDCMPGLTAALTAGVCAGGRHDLVVDADGVNGDRFGQLRAHEHPPPVAQRPPDSHTTSWPATRSCMNSKMYRFWKHLVAGAWSDTR